MTIIPEVKAFRVDEVRGNYLAGQQREQAQQQQQTATQNALADRETKLGREATTFQNQQTNQRMYLRLDPVRRSEIYRLSVSKQGSMVATLIYSPIRSDR